MKNEISGLFFLGAVCLIIEGAPTVEQTKEMELVQSKIENHAVQVYDEKYVGKSGYDGPKKRRRPTLSELFHQFPKRESPFASNSAPKKSKIRKTRATTLTLAFEIDDILAFFLGERWRKKKQ